MVRVGLAITALTTLGNSEETQRTPAQVILIKLGQMAEGWTDFFIGNVIERPGRAENFKARMAARIERIEKHYIDCKSKPQRQRKRRSNKLEGVAPNRFLPIKEHFLIFQKRIFSLKYLNPSSEQLYDDSGRQMKQLSTDPVRSNSQIYVNLKNWVAANMNECPHALKHYNKLSAMQNKWTGVFDDVLKKITERRG
jgi:hypothetical protein